MKKSTPEKQTLLDHVSHISDPRQMIKCRHPMVNIVATATCGVIAGADDWNATEAFGQAKKDWFGSFLDLTSGIPSHDTFRRFFSILSPKIFQTFFEGWFKNVAGLVEDVPTVRIRIGITSM